VRRIAPIMLNAFVFRSWKPGDPLLVALDVLRELYATDHRKLPSRAPTTFLRPAWRKLVGTGAAADSRAYQVAVMTALRDCLRPGDVWVEGSRAFRAFDDFLLPPETFAARQRDDGLGLAVSGRFDAWRAERVALLESRLREIDAIASAGKLVEAVITAEGLSISPIRRDENLECEDIYIYIYHAPALRHVAAPAHHRASRRGAWLDWIRRTVLPSANGRRPRTTWL
jgi:hypothetical protein